MRRSTTPNVHNQHCHAYADHIQSITTTLLPDLHTTFQTPSTCWSPKPEGAVAVALAASSRWQGFPSTSSLHWVAQTLLHNIYSCKLDRVDPRCANTCSRNAYKAHCMRHCSITGPSMPHSSAPGFTSITATTAWRSVYFTHGYAATEGSSAASGA